MKDFVIGFLLGAITVANWDFIVAKVTVWLYSI